MWGNWGVMWGQRREEGLGGWWPAERVKGREGDWSSAWCSKLTHSHRTQTPIRVTETLIKPDLQALAAGWENVCVEVFKHGSTSLKYSHTVLNVSHSAKSCLHLSHSSTVSPKDTDALIIPVSCFKTNIHLAVIYFPLSAYPQGYSTGLSIMSQWSASQISYQGSLRAKKIILPMWGEIWYHLSYTGNGTVWRFA